MWRCLNSRETGQLLLIAAAVGLSTGAVVGILICINTMPPIPEPATLATYWAACGGGVIGPAMIIGVGVTAFLALAARIAQCRFSVCPNSFR
ncbi:MAG: hypothetical protein QNJ53_23350 [Pleurocapsa sp. MO_192.B19]|nr:hypothetical protein [Pleurocapsa sp. MO_192.B19]